VLNILAAQRHCYRSSAWDFPRVLEGFALEFLHHARGFANKTISSLGFPTPNTSWSSFVQTTARAFSEVGANS